MYMCDTGVTMLSSAYSDMCMCDTGVTVLLSAYSDMCMCDTGVTVLLSAYSTDDSNICMCDTGVTMLLSAYSDDSDMLWLTSSDNFPFRSLLSESHVCNSLFNHVFVSLAEPPNEQINCNIHQ